MQASNFHAYHLSIGRDTLDGSLPNCILNFQEQIVNFSCTKTSSLSALIAAITYAQVPIILRENSLIEIMSGSPNLNAIKTACS